MAMILSKLLNRAQQLKTKHLFGRLETTVDTVVSSCHASRDHSSIEWIDGVWEYFDHSRNGSAVNGQQILPGNRATLKKGDRISFGSEDIFEFVDDSPPRVLLLNSSDSRRVLEVEEISAFPGDDNPEVTIYKKEDSWYAESNKVTQLLICNQAIEIAKSQWIFFDPFVSDATKKQNNMTFAEPVLFEIHPSLNFENVKIIGKHQDREVDLGYRNHHFLLLVLAKLKELDKDKKVNPVEQGWVDGDLLSQRLQLDLSHMNIQVFRARKQFTKAFGSLVTADDVVMRRSGELRLGFQQFEIVGDFTLPF